MTTSRKDRNGLPKRQAVMVMGMHRSGTSALSGLLMRLGGDGPSTPLGPGKDNPAGYFESRALFPLQDELLGSAGTSWDDYRPFPESWLTSPKADEFRHRIGALLEAEYGSSGFFVVKDPRNCRLVPFWCEVLAAMQVQPLFVHTHRNPLEVARSLHRRDGFDPEYGGLLWLRHILDAEIGSRGHIRSFTSYDRLLAGWPAEVEKIAGDLGISWPRYGTAQLSSLAAMIRPDLKHNNASDLTQSQVFATWFREALDIFDRWAAHGEDRADHARLDQIRQMFDDSAGVFGDVVHAKGRALMGERDKARQEAGAAREKAEAARAQGGELQAGHDALAAERDEALRVAAEARQEADGLRAQGVELQAGLDALAVERDEARQEAGAARQEADGLRAQGVELQTGLDALSAENVQIAAQLDLSRNMLDQRKAEIDDTADELQKTRTALTDAEGRAEKLSCDLDQAGEQIRVLQANETRRDRELASVQMVILQYQDRAAAAEAVKRDEVAALTKMASQLNDRLAQSEARVNALLTSNSWKVTAPIRWVVTRLRG